MRRILKFFGRLILLTVCIGAIVFLANSTVNGARDLVSRFNTRRLHDEQRASFPTLATAIGEINARLSQEKTNAPTPTITPSETEELPVGIDVTSTTTGQNAPSMMLSNAQAQTEAPTETPTVPPTATTLPPPTSTVPPTSTRRATATQAAVQALPPTNTKRASATTAPTLPPSPTIPPTVPPTATPTTTATLAATSAATAASTSNDTAMNPALAPTSKLPPVFAPGECTDKQQATAVPARAPRVSAKGNDILNIMLIGTDADVDPTDPAFRTDSLVIVSINRTTNTAAMMSIPRDLYLCIPTLGMNRINLAYARGEIVKWQPGGGFGLLQATILYNLGIPVHYYARIGLLGFKQVVDTLGGIDIAVDCPISGLRFQGQYSDKQTPVYANFKLNLSPRRSRVPCSSLTFDQCNDP
jgi:LCP family protein required for cell wall assembly